MFAFLRKEKPAKGLAGLADLGRELALAHLTLQAANPVLSKGARVGVDKADTGQALERAVAEAGLEGQPCNFVLGARDYKLLLVEAPKVKPEEMSAAIRWRIKDLLDQPLEDSVIDVFPVPQEAYRSQGQMVYAAVSRKSRVIEVRDLVNASGLVLESIDIPELAMLNLSNIAADDGNGLAFLHMSPAGSILNLCRDGAIFLTRHLSTHIDAGAVGGGGWAALKDRLVLEIQRSLDYYESQMGQKQIARLLVSPQEGEDPEAMARELDEAMGVRVQSLSLAGALPVAAGLEAFPRGDSLLALGAALRHQAGRQGRRDAAA